MRNQNTGGICYGLDFYVGAMIMMIIMGALCGTAIAINDTITHWDEIVETWRTAAAILAASLIITSPVIFFIIRWERSLGPK